MEDSRYYIYMLTNKRHRIFHVGVTTNIKRRMKEHKQGEFDDFSKRYDCNKLVYFEVTFEMGAAWERKRIIESLSRADKIQLITASNPWWRNFSAAWSGNKQFNSTSALITPEKSTDVDMAPPNRLPEEEMLSFAFEDA
jgi:putative endonuclease